eukprot:8654349-Pyramimonas_sp.AAC.1
METVLSEHHRLALQLYDVALAKPKLHFTRHIPKNIRNVGDVLSCFATERKHKFAKCIGEHSGGEHWEHAVMKRQLLDILVRFQGGIPSEWLIGRVTSDVNAASLLMASHGIPHVGPSHRAD